MISCFPGRAQRKCFNCQSHTARPTWSQEYAVHRGRLKPLGLMGKLSVVSDNTALSGGLTQCLLLISKVTVPPQSDTHDSYWDGHAHVLFTTEEV